MYTIRAQFCRLRDTSVLNLLNAIGVYVIWDARAIARPTYIGEGNILRRLADHMDRERTFAHPWDGYFAVLDSSTPNVHKFEGRAIERLLLDVASLTDRMPAANKAPGSMSVVLQYVNDESLRVAISGYDPFAPPMYAKPLRSAMEIKVRQTRSGDVEVGHNWRMRKLRAPII